MESSLAALVKADSEDFSSRSKLRLSRMCKVLTDPNIVVSLAISVVGSGPVELLQYQLLGHERRRVSLVDLCHPVRSPLIVCQNGLAKLATAFHGRLGSPWYGVHLVGGKLDDASVRLAARRYILIMAAG